MKSLASPALVCCSRPLLLAAALLCLAIPAGRAAEKTPELPPLDPVCGFTAGPHFYLETSAVRQGLRVELLNDSAQTDRPSILRFVITRQPRGGPVDKLQVEHEKFMHVIGMREDLSEFFHIHPVRVAPGKWEVTYTFAQGGRYKIWTDVKYLATSYSFAQPILTVSGPIGRAVSAMPETNSVVVAGYRVKLDHAQSLKAQQANSLEFTLTDASGTPLELENFLGTPMHLFIVNEDATTSIHAHPASSRSLGGMVQFLQTFPAGGTYKLFAEFRPKEKHLSRDESLLAEFVVTVPKS